MSLFRLFAAISALLLAGCGLGLSIDDGSISEVNSSIEVVGDPIADGSLFTVKVTFRTFYGNPVAGATPVLSFEGFRNTLNQTCTPSDASGTSLCEGAIASTVSGQKGLAVTSPVFVVSRPTFAEKERGYNARACGMDLNRNGVRGEAADCKVCDGKTTDPDGDGVNEDLIYVDATLGNNATATGTPSAPYQTIAAAMAAADGPGDGAEDIFCLSGTFQEAVTLPQSGLAGQYTVDSANLPSQPLILMGWDRDGDGFYPPVDSDDVAVIHGQGLLTRGLTLTARSQIEVAHLTFRGFRDPAATGGGFVQVNGASQLIHFHDLEVLEMNDGMAENPAVGRGVFHINTSTLSDFSLENSDFSRSGARFWYQFTSTYGSLTRLFLDNNSVVMNSPPPTELLFMVRAADRMNLRRNAFRMDTTGWALSISEQFHAILTLGCVTRFNVERNDFLGFSTALYLAYSGAGLCTPSVTQDDIVFDSNRHEGRFERRDSVVLSNAINDGSVDSATNTIEDARITNNFLMYRGTSQGDSCIWLNAGNSTAVNPGTVVIAGNTCVGPYYYHGIGVEDYTGGPALTFPVQNVRLFNNIIQVSNPLGRNIHSTTAPSGWQAGGNIYDANTLGWRWGGSYPATLSTWQAATGQDTLADTCIPSLIDLLNFDLHLSPTDSCARSRGVDISTYTTRDFDGDTRPMNVPDVGADEIP